ncbi:MAG: tetratricopeptide repeat protein [Balneolaceae bacterium]
MNISFMTRFAGLILVAGFFYSCGSTQPNIDELVQNNQYERALIQLDEMIERNPDQPELYIQRGEISALLARELNPEERTPLYSDTAEDFNTAEEYGATDAQKSSIDSLRQQLWKDEHNEGLRASEREDDDQYQIAETHFTNAILLRSGAMSSYQNLAIALFNQGKVDEAIESLHTALNFTDDPPVALYEFLGYLYLEKGDPDEASQYYELANKNLADNLNIAFGLINAYIAAGNSEKAAELLEPMVENNPQNADLRNVYGTQLYEITAQIMDDLKIAYQENDSALVEQLQLEAEGIGEQAEIQLVEAYKRDTLNTEYLESLAVFYNNLSGQYFSMLDVAFDSDEKELKEKALTLIDFAIEYYTKLVEADPNNDVYNSKLNVLKNLKQNQSTSGQN